MHHLDLLESKVSKVIVPGVLTECAESMGNSKTRGLLYIYIYMDVFIGKDVIEKCFGDKKINEKRLEDL